MNERLRFALRAWLYGLIAVIVCTALLLPLLAFGQIPREAEKWRRILTQQVRLEWGLDAPVATFAAQVQQESSFNPDARSTAGALGIAQFLPATAVWISGAYSALGPSDPLNPQWALRALAAYDLDLWKAVSAIDDCNRAAKMLSSYNGGSKWIPRDEKLAAANGLWPEYWWDSVETVNAGRSSAAWKENRAYPRAILLTNEPRYVAALWGRGLCD